MKKTIITFTIFILAVSPTFYAAAQKSEIEQLLLNVEKLAQFKQILADMKKGYEILEGGYSTIRDISKGNFNLHKAFLDALLEVSPVVRSYRRVADITKYQIMLVREYRQAFDRFIQDDNFNSGELSYIGRVYDNLFNESLRNLDELSVVITAGKVRMSDDERLAAIDRIYADMEDKLSFLRSFNNNTTILAVQRAKERYDAAALKKMYGLDH